MSSSHGSFVWYELMTSDPRGAEDFYRRVVGRGDCPADGSHLSYTMFTTADVASGSLAPLSTTGARPGWLAYVEVDDVDAGAAHAARSGGVIRRSPTDIPNIGRFAVVSDPQGGTVALFKPLPSESEIRPPTSSVSVGWHELHAANRDEALTFYAGLFGWTKGRALDMGDMGIYQLFDHDGASIGGMMTKPATVPGPFWLFYFNVKAIQPAITRVRQAGGEILNGPHQVPGGSWIVQCLDPQGGLFALVEQNT